ncbi:MAG: helix-turn-helix transcriptional regulator [Bacteroidetes bacterium]|nr:helix-turn-helix transcriptional regulator [Bacteroidota bacterium]
MNEYTINKIPSDVLKDIAQKHRYIRKQLKLSQVELSQRSGVSLGSIKRFESTGKIALEALLKLVFVLGRLEDFETVLKPKDSLIHIEKLFSNKTKI